MHLARRLLSLVGFHRGLAMSISIAGTASSPLLSTITSGKLDKPLDAKTAEQQFIDTIGETPAQRMFNAMLGQLGITPDQFKAMDPDQQREVAQKIQQLIEQQAQNGGSKSPGQITDKTV
jgi:hypothetical protein